MQDAEYMALINSIWRRLLTWARDPVTLESMSKRLARRRPANWAGAEDLRDALFAEALKTCARCTRCIENCISIQLSDNQMRGEVGRFD